MQLRNKTVWMLVLAAIIVAGLGSLIGRAAVANDVAYINVNDIGDKYIKPLIEGPLKQDMQKLQSEFDVKSKGQTDETKAELFNSYQARLDARRQELIDANMVKVRTAAQQVAQSAGYKVVLDKDMVVAGGIDITSQVLTKVKAMK